MVRSVSAAAEEMLQAFANHGEDRAMRRDGDDCEQALASISGTHGAGSTSTSTLPANRAVRLRATGGGGTDLRITDWSVTLIRFEGEQLA
jgi:hypothetical protein